ncbi:hypothetical protein HF526_30560 [Pseudonocardia sp. K10HN5]|uniref:Dolichyl-phosphate-mannose-protein mannosyltransferase n=1 Tax=Pseudonocardia acidicola TaxID=2724939 RepID=A0ABX1SM08_9PSEU|nr:hypothetical protein [Pseudonocardia acidicola]NMI01608.1 hypothetical protein [Pseudonocardia acidicola]
MRRDPLAALAATLAPAVIFALVRGLGVIVLAALAAANDTRLGTALRAWDGEWFLGLAQGGYDGVPPGLADANGMRTAETPLAFFPGYPATTAALRFLTGLPSEAAGVAAATLAGIAAAYGVCRLGRLVPGGSRRVGLIMVALFAGTPMGVVLTMAYSEALFCALAAWSLVGVLSRRWVLAGAMCGLAGLVRPTAAALVLAVGMAALVAVVQRHDGLRPWAGAALAPLGLLGYLGWVAARTGSATGWFDLQNRGWGSRFDGGAATAQFAASVLVSVPSAFEVLTVAVLAGGLVLLAVGVVRAVRGGLPWPLLVYGAGVLIMDVGSNGLMNSKARLLLPAFTLLLPVALGLARRRPATTVATLVAVALGSAWFGAYALTAWQYAI